MPRREQYGIEQAGELRSTIRAEPSTMFVGTDTASCVQRFTSVRIAAVPSGPGNLKITFPQDVQLAERMVIRQAG